jgi:stage V sporulation protein S
MSVFAKPDFDLMYHSMVEEGDIIKVTGAANPRTIATSIDYAFQRSNEVVVRAMGAAAVNQAAKGVAIARGVVAPRAVDMVARVGFTDIAAEDGEVRSAIVFRLTLT